MAVTAKSRLQLFVALLHRLLSRILKPHLVRRALTAILQCLARIWTFLRRKLLPRPKKGLDYTPKGSEALSNSTDNSESKKPLARDTTLSDSSTPKDKLPISLDGVACSTLPYIPRMQKDSTRSLQNLTRSREQHALNVAVSRNGSRVSQITYDLDQPQTPIEGKVGEGYTIGVESPSRSATGAFGISASSPDLRLNTGALFDLHSRTRTSSPVPSSIADHQRQLQPAPSIHTYSSQGEIEGLLQSDIFPIAPEKLKRYLNRPKLTPEQTSYRFIPPLTLSYTEELSLSEGWVVHTHSEGAPYFFNADKRIYTDADLFQPKIFAHVKTVSGRIFRLLRQRPEWSLPAHYNLVLDIEHIVDDIFSTDYYFVDHASRMVFWLDDFSTEGLDVMPSVLGRSTLSHIGREIETQYWQHCQMFPTSFDLTQKLVRELRDIILQNIGDTTTSPYSTSPYELDELHRMLSLMPSIERNIGDDPLNIGTRNLVARFFWLFARERFSHFYGEPCARLDRTQSVYQYLPNVGDRTWLIKSVTLLLFLAPEVNLRTLQKMFVDQSVNKPLFERSMKKLNDEWQEITLFATVLLNANVAFLAIQSVDSGEPSRTPIQISCYLSIVASIGCIMLSLLLIRQTRNKSRECASEASDFLTRRSSVAFGVESLAIVYSLPYALLMWAMISFLSAFCFLCYLKTSITTRAIVTPPGLGLAVFIGWSLWLYWETKPDKTTPTAEPPSDNDTKSFINASPESASLNSEKPPPRKTWASLPRFAKLTWPPFQRRKDSGQTIGNDQSHV